MRNKNIIKYIYNGFEPFTIMKPSLAILILAVGLLSCKDDPVLSLTPELVFEINSYDLDNNGNSSDIRVDFVVKDNLNVIEYRIMVIPSSAGNSFNEGMALSVRPVSFLEVTPESFKVQHSVKRLPSGLLDVNGAQIQNDIEYVAAVFVIGASNQQLSQFSTPFTLKDQGIYSGMYWIGGTCNGLQQFPGNGDSFINLIGRGNIYLGITECIGCSPGGYLGSVSFSVQATTITAYVHQDADWACPLSVTECGVDGLCPFIEQGEGNIIDELILEIDFSGGSCYWSCEPGTRTFIRQG